MTPTAKSTRDFVERPSYVLQGSSATLGRPKASLGSTISKFINERKEKSAPLEIGVSQLARAADPLKAFGHKDAVLLFGDKNMIESERRIENLKKYCKTIFPIDSQAALTESNWVKN